MAQNNNAVRDALTDALLPKDAEGEPGNEEVTEGTAPAEATETETEQTTDTTEAAGTASAEEETPAADVPTEYFGVDLSDLPTEQRAEVIAGYQERDKFIQQLLRDKSATPEGEQTPDAAAPAAPAATESDAEVSDKDILEALGIDPEYADSPESKAILTLARMNLGLQEQLQGVASTAEMERTERYWTTSLAALEKQYGTLPSGITHDDVMREAAKSSIAEPMDAYWRIMGPGRQQVMTEVQKRRAALTEELRKTTQGTQRPTSAVDTEEKPIVAKDIREAARIAMQNLAKERGYTFTE